MEPKILCIYHSRDLDGWMSAAIVKKRFPSVEFIGWDYGQELPDLSSVKKDELVIMVDISFPILKMGWLDENTNLIWIDHHISAINESRESIEGIRSVKYAACELTWEYFFPDDHMPEPVRLLGMYDSFRHKGTDEENAVLWFQYAVRAFCSTPEDCYNMMLDSFDEVQSWIKRGFFIHKYLVMMAKQDYAKGFPVFFHQYKFIMVNAERFNPINFGINYHEDGYDGAGCFHFKNGKWEFSIYNDNGKVDVSEIAKELGGGGHRGAAGFIFTGDITKFLNDH
jgi:oligoribonuclease NrnB/cAMP/cGMP phosphodiesterase (DHH superfamily)